MKVFLDTNIFLEYLCGRSKATLIRDLLDVIEDKSFQTFFSSSSFCTISYYVELTLKEMGIKKPEKTARTREILNGLLNIATIADVDHPMTVIATNDTNFSDFEDSMQYRCALKAKCDVLITINTKDFRYCNQSAIKVMTPECFLETYR